MDERITQKLYDDIQDYINYHDFTYKVSDVIHYYTEYWIKGFYVSCTMEQCINRFEMELRGQLDGREN
jgi:hypothetical protein